MPKAASVSLHGDLVTLLQLDREAAPNLCSLPTVTVRVPQGRFGCQPGFAYCRDSLLLIECGRDCTLLDMVVRELRDEMWTRTMHLVKVMLGRNDDRA